MSTAIVVHERFDGAWPFAADQLHEMMRRRGPVEFVRVRGATRPEQALRDPGSVEKLVTLQAEFTAETAARLPRLREIWLELPGGVSPELRKAMESRGVKVHECRTESFWGQSVSEFALALTLSALRRIPQQHRQIIESQALWDYTPDPKNPGQRGWQFGDDPRFSSGTVAGKRVRVVGVGNIGSRYASFCHMLGADVAAWDPLASDPCFHRSGARRVKSLEALVGDAEIFAPILPLRPETEGIVKAAHIEALPRGCLVVLVTRSAIVDMPTLRRRVLNDELSLAADVFDVEPLPLTDPLLGRHNVVHTPHNAGRTIHAGQQYAEMIAAAFDA